MAQKVNKVYVGIDVSSDKVDICIKGTNKVEVIPNDKKSIEEYFKRLKRSCDIELIAIEHTGGYEQNAIDVIAALGIDIHTAHPLQVHYYTKCVPGHKAKTDEKDAQALARYASEPYVKKSNLRSFDQRKLRSLSRRRTQLIDQIEAEKKRCKMMFSLIGEESFKAVIEALEKAIQQIDDDIKAMLCGNPVWKKLFESLQEVKSIGFVTAATLVALVPELGTLNRNQIASMLGLAPFNRDSGKRFGKRFISGGRFWARRALYMATIVAIRHNPTIKKMAERLKAKGKTSKQTIVACMRKLLIHLNSLSRKALCNA